jgi:hypothetical protein
MSYTPSAIAEKGEKLYKERFRQQFEPQHLGKFLAIEVESERAFLADTPEAALQNAGEAIPQGSFHLIKIGSSGVFKVSYVGRTSADWIFQP